MNTQKQWSFNYLKWTHPIQINNYLHKNNFSFSEYCIQNEEHPQSEAAALACFSRDMADRMDSSLPDGRSCNSSSPAWPHFCLTHFISPSVPHPCVYTHTHGIRMESRQNREAAQPSWCYIHPAGRMDRGRWGLEALAGWRQRGWTAAWPYCIHKHQLCVILPLSITSSTAASQQLWVLYMCQLCLCVCVCVCVCGTCHSGFT